MQILSINQTAVPWGLTFLFTKPTIPLSVNSFVVSKITFLGIVLY